MPIDISDLALENGEALWEEANRPDPMPARRTSVAKAIDKQITKAKEGSTRGVWWKTTGDMTQLEIKVGSVAIPFAADGMPVVWVSKDNLVKVLERVKDGVLSYKLDAEINAAWPDSADKAGGSIPAIRETTRTGGRGKPRGPMSEETKRKISEARKRNAAAK